MPPLTLPSGSFVIVAVGASAGGLEAFTQLLSALPADTDMAFVLILHLRASQPSFLAEILAWTTAMPVIQVQNGFVVVPKHVYVIPPNQQMAISSGVLTLSLRPKTGLPFMSIDFFFQSLAEDWGNKAIGVVLSGANSDGAQGVRAIKAAGGLTFAQDEQSAQYPDMPRSAAATGLVDFVLPPQQIAVQLAAVGHHRLHGPHAPGHKEEKPSSAGPRRPAKAIRVATARTRTSATTTTTAT